MIFFSLFHFDLNIKRFIRNIMLKIWKNGDSFSFITLNKFYCYLICNENTAKMKNLYSHVLFAVKEFYYLRYVIKIRRY